MGRKYLLLPVVVLALTLVGCEGCQKKLAPPPAPAAPSDLAGIAVSFSEINLTWKDNSPDETGFYIYRKTTADYSREAVMEKDATSYNDTGLEPETAYSYKITAYNDSGESGFSNALCVHTPAETEPEPDPLQAPSNVMAEAVSYKQINLTWQDNSDDEDNFRIASDLGLGPGNNQFLVRLPANTTYYEHQNLQPMREYKYFVVAERKGIDASSERFWATTFEAPVEILYSELQFWSNTRWKIWGDISSGADEPCLVEITGYLYKQGTNEAVASGTDTFYVNAGALKYFEILISEGGPSEPKCYPDCEYSIEITDVEIVY